MVLRQRGYAASTGTDLRSVIETAAVNGTSKS